MKTIYFFFKDQIPVPRLEPEASDKRTYISFELYHSSRTSAADTLSLFISIFAPMRKTLRRDNRHFS